MDRYFYPDVFDPVYYFFWIEHGMYEADRTRVYPAPPASYVVAGPMSKEELETYLTQLPKEERNALWSWSCHLNEQGQKVCLVKNIRTTYLNKNDFRKELLPIPRFTGRYKI